MIWSRVTNNLAATKLAIDSQGQFLYVATSANSIDVVDINPQHATFHKVVRTVALPEGVRRRASADMVLSNDRRRLYVASYKNNARGQELGLITVINVDPTREQHGAPVTIEVPGGTPYRLFEAAASEDDDQERLAFTYWYRFATVWRFFEAIDNAAQVGPIERFGTLTLGKDALRASTDGQIQVNSAELKFRDVSTKMGDRNWLCGGPKCTAVSPSFAGYHLNALTPSDVVISSDLQYAYVADSQKISVANFAGLRGDKISVIRNPFGLANFGNTKLLGSTTPIPGGKADTLALSADGARLFAAYLGANEILVLDTEEMTRIVSTADLKALEITPIDQVAGNQIHITPISQAGRPRGLSLMTVDFLTLTNLDPVSVEKDATPPTFQWNVNQAITGSHVRSDLFVSALPPGKGLFPDECQAPSIDCRDNAGDRRISTKTGLNDTFEFRPDKLVLTAGQTYYWGVQVTTQDGRVERQSGRFQSKPIDIVGPTSQAFESVTIITHSLEVRTSARVDDGHGRTDHFGHRRQGSHPVVQ